MCEICIFSTLPLLEDKISDMKEKCNYDFLNMTKIFLKVSKKSVKMLKKNHK